MKKIFLTFLIVLISIAQSVFVFDARAAVSPQIGDIFCQQGVAYFDRDQFPEALVEFKKALLANPESQVAREYIEMTERELSLRQGLLACTQVSKKNLVDLYLSGMEQKMIAPPQESASPATPVCDISDAGATTRLSSAAAALASSGGADVSTVPMTKTAGPSATAQTPAAKADASGPVVIDMAAYESPDITLYVDEPVLLKGIAISRFLVTHPAILQASQPAKDEVLLQPREIGNCYLHLWGDNNERKSYKVTIGPRRFEEILAQAARAKKYEESLPESFKFTYSISGDSYLTGRGVGDLHRTSHTMAYTSSVIGETPYGMFDTSVQGNRTNLGQYRVSNVRMGLTDAHFDEFKDIDIRMFDYGPSFSAFGFPGGELRGVKVDAPMFQKSLNYSAFWGAVPKGDFSFLAPDEGLSKTKKAWIEGVGVSYDVSRFANFKTFYAHSYGPERNEPVLTSDTAGLQMNYDLGVWDFGTGMVSDMTHNSYTAETSFTIPKLRVGLNMTDNAKNFASLLGGVPTTGSTNGTLSINYRPTDSVTIYNAFSGTHDKVFNNPDNPGRPNYNSTTRLNWVLDMHTELEAGYIMDDQIGSNTPAVTETKELMLRKKFFLIRRLSTYLLYQNRKSKNYTSPAQNFNNNRLLG
ncbi:MAG: tetratricopeptide repeat protein, partial [Candidatus Omnitrophica bacterium]|nr:tetratricopeptide repeat protein [Candidatus Omnitrophota bacterium]